MCCRRGCLVCLLLTRRTIQQHAIDVVHSSLLYARTSFENVSCSRVTHCPIIYIETEYSYEHEVQYVHDARKLDRAPPPQQNDVEQTAIYTANEPQHSQSRTRKHCHLSRLPSRRTTVADARAPRAHTSTLIADHPLDVLLQKRARPRTDVRIALNRDWDVSYVHICATTLQCRELTSTMRANSRPVQ